MSKSSRERERLASRPQPAVASGTWPRSLLLFLSGTVALIFQVLWIKQLSLVVGVDVHAITTGVSAFFAGLALGGLVLGRLADRSLQPLRLYAAFEIGVALLGIATTLTLGNSARIFATLESTSGPLAWVYLFVIVGLAPFLMGGTLPAVVRSLSLGPDRIGSGGGGMYAANTTGAIAGALLCSFFLIPTFGILGTSLFAGCIGILAGLGALWLNRSSPLASPVESATSPPGNFPAAARVAILFYAVAGGLALGYEIVWAQSAVPLMSTRTFAFSVMLATYLTGLAIGAALFARASDRVENPWGLFGLLIAAAGLVALLEIAFLGSWLSGIQAWAQGAAFSMTDSRLAGMCARFAIAAIYIVLVPTMLLGAAFPAALRLVVDAGHVGRDVGRVVALNTLGGIVGTVVTGFLLMPHFGVVRTLAILAVIATTLGYLAARRGTAGSNRTRMIAIVFAVTALGLGIFIPADRLSSLLGSSRGGKTLYYKEGQGGTVAVLEQTAGSKNFRRLYIQGVSNTGDAMPSLRYMRLQSLLPLIIHNGEPKSALVIGLGTGITSGALLEYPGLEQRVVAELLPEVVEASKLFSGNYNAATDPRLDIRLRDGRRELLRSEEKYDLITLEPPPPSAAGVVNLYSSDFYQLARARLQKGGIVAQWLPLPTQNDGDTRSLVRSFLDVYPHASLWTTELHEMLLVGSLEPLVLDAARITQRMAQPGVSASLAEVGIAGPEALLATWITDRDGLETYAGDAPPVTDNQPRIEYADWVRRDELQRVLPTLIELRTDPPLIGADEDFLKMVGIERQRLLVFYQAALNAQAGHADLWERDMKRLLESAPGNPYFAWFIGAKAPENN